MTALVDERTAVELDQALWQLWKDMDVPEGFRAEIIEGSIEVSPTGRFRHSDVIGRLLEALMLYLHGTAYTARNDTNVIDGLKVYIPDLFVGPRDLEQIRHPEGLGVIASGVLLVVEVVSPGHNDRQRDRVRKRRAYARAGIPVYLLIDDYDNDGTITILTAPDEGTGDYQNTQRSHYGSDPVIPEGPAKGFTIGADITRSV